MIETRCPHCGKILQLPEEFIGQQGRCKICNEIFTALPLEQNVKVLEKPIVTRKHRLVPSLIIALCIVVSLAVGAALYFNNYIPLRSDAGHTRMFNGNEFAWIPPGTFEMGSNISADNAFSRYGDGGLKEWEGLYKDEHPRHQVILTKGFWICTNTVTVYEFEMFINTTGYQTDAEKFSTGRVLDLNQGDWVDKPGTTWRNPGWEPKPNEPVVMVSWNDAQVYCRWLSEKTGDTYRLPTEAEWEYACRAGTTTEYWWGDNSVDGQGCLNARDESKLPGEKKGWRYSFPFSDGYWNVAPVGSFEANPWNLHDMLGNVWEWCQDRYGEYTSDIKTDPSGPVSGEYRVTRGGAWISHDGECRSASRHNIVPAYRGSHVGFRVVRSSSNNKDLRNADYLPVGDDWTNNTSLLEEQSLRSFLSRTTDRLAKTNPLYLPPGVTENMLSPEMRSKLSGKQQQHGQTTAIPQICSMNQECLINGIGMTVYSVYAWQDTFSMPTYPAPGNCFIAIDVSITNKRHDKLSINPLSFTAVNEKGQFFNGPGFMVGKPEPKFPLAEIYSSEVARGWIVLEIPVQTVDLFLDYTYYDDTRLRVRLR